MPKEENLPTNVKEALASIRNLIDVGGDYLDLSHKKLKTNQLTILMPIIKKKLPHLTRINLSHNNLDELPAEISQLNRLASINLNANNLSQLPDELFDIPNLGGIFLEDNNLTAINESISNLKFGEGIYELALNGNPISRESITYIQDTFFGGTKDSDGKHLFYDSPSEEELSENEQKETTINETALKNETSDFDSDDESNDEIEKEVASNSANLKRLAETPNEGKSIQGDTKRRKPNSAVYPKSTAKRPQSPKL